MSYNVIENCGYNYNYDSYFKKLPNLEAIHIYESMDVSQIVITLFQVLFEIIKTYTSIHLRKEFNITQFLDNLQYNSLIEFFSTQKYRSLVTIPDVKLKKRKDKVWIAEVWIAEALFYYAHPFLFSDVFRQKLTNQQKRDTNSVILYTLISPPHDTSYHN